LLLIKAIRRQRLQNWNKPSQMTRRHRSFVCVLLPFTYGEENYQKL